MSAQNNPRNIELNWKTDTTKHSAPLNEFTALMKPDGIPPIDSPKFWEKERAQETYFEHEPVIAVEINGQAKAYPLSVLMYHEIVNDELYGVSFSATYCPLCNAALVFDRRLEFEGKKYLLDFGVSGMLRNSDLVMWDRQTESWWQQFLGEALVGELTGAQLEIIPSMLISIAEFFESYPNGLVLSTETGISRKYGTNPYISYDNLENKQPRLFNGEVDDRLPAMERVIDIEVDGKYKIYPLSEISKKGAINDNFEGQAVVFFHTEKTVSVLDENNIAQSKQIGSVTVFDPRLDDKLLTFNKTKKGFVDKETNSVWSITGKCIAGKLKGKELRPLPHGNHFAFAWFAFHPETEIYK
ncbi:DUF3179 domain-containing protein [Prolixibacter sp. NT017]|uniref:DUF3179 domain-containing protein n=1 Tax=Prolixibacter sp. NT017 TaxID=2652390 RepID=UPI00127FE9AA|nr:DUF3179 domain-containing protein [Prolixibacter sp. NT017]GET24421.1 hypothetical protein NT017_07500 [Prolixibacter sp. NT017]